MANILAFFALISPVVGVLMNTTAWYMFITKPVDPRMNGWTHKTTTALVITTILSVTTTTLWMMVMARLAR